MALITGAYRRQELRRRRHGGVGGGALVQHRQHGGFFFSLLSLGALLARIAFVAYRAVRVARTVGRMAKTAGQIVKATKVAKMAAKGAQMVKKSKSVAKGMKVLKKVTKAAEKADLVQDQVKSVIRAKNMDLTGRTKKKKLPFHPDPNKRSPSVPAVGKRVAHLRRPQRVSRVLTPSMVVDRRRQRLAAGRDLVPVI